MDEKALGDALRSGHLMAAALDVVENEPLSPDHPLMELENVILTPIKRLTLERALHFVREDELVEVTPKSIRLRKTVLSAQRRYQMAGIKAGKRGE